MKLLSMLFLFTLFSCSNPQHKVVISNVDAYSQTASLAHFNKKLNIENGKYNVELKAPYFETTSKEIAASSLGVRAITLKRFNKIANLKKNEASFDNTIVALENLQTEFFETLSRIGFIKYTSKIKAVRDAAKSEEVILERFIIEQEFRYDVYEVIHHYTLTNPQLEGVDKRLFDGVVRSYKRQGMDKKKNIRKKIEKLKKQISEIEVKISNNIASDKSIVILSDAEVKELPTFVKETLKKNINNKYFVRVSVRYQAYGVIDYSPREYLRKKVFTKMVSRQSIKNKVLMEKVVYLKSILASKLGYRNWADYKLEVKMAKKGSHALHFERNLIAGLDGKFKKEINDLLLIKIAETNNKKAKIESWDLRYYKRLFEKEKFDLDLDSLKKYFSMDNVLVGMFDVFEDIFQLKIEYVKAPYVWDSLVRMIKISDSKTHKPLGLLYLDLFPRPDHDKYGHFAMFGINDNMLLSNKKQRRPVAALLCNFPLPLNNKPSLLSLDHVETLFHEFGHALHHILSESKYASFAGTNVPRDFVEAPSQMLENWVHDKNVLDRFAFDYQDPSKKFPLEMLKKIKMADRATKAMFYRRQLAFGLLDLELHTMNKSKSKKFDIIKQTNKAINDTYLAYPKTSSFITSFGHIFGGYDAGYYGYAWADNIAADMASIFEKAPNAFLNKEVGMRLRKEIYQTGDTREISTSIEAFLGRKTNSKAFYSKLGIE